MTKKFSSHQDVRIIQGVCIWNLKKGFANHHLMQNGAIGVVQFVTAGLTKEAFPLVVGTDASIPFLLPLKGQGKVNKNISL